MVRAFGSAHPALLMSPLVSQTGQDLSLLSVCRPSHGLDAAGCEPTAPQLAHFFPPPALAFPHFGHVPGFIVRIGVGESCVFCAGDGFQMVSRDG